MLDTMPQLFETADDLDVTGDSPWPIVIEVWGKPQTAGSKRAFVLKRRDGSLITRGPGGPPIVNTVDDNANSRAWKEQVASAAVQVFAGELLTDVLDVTFTFTMVRPLGHFGARGLKPSAPRRPGKKPDALKLARAAEDALTGVIWRDDAQIVDEHLHKRWGERAGLRIEIRPAGD